MSIAMVLVTAVYIARKLTAYEGKPMTVEIIDVKQPESLAGRYEVPNTRAQMMQFQGQLIRCKLYFREGKPIRLTKVQPANK